MFPIGDENQPGHGLAWVTVTRALPSATPRASWR
jgi:hypothetical protein